MGANSPSRLNYVHLTIKKDPYGDLIMKWADERGITRVEMLERITMTYAAFKGQTVIGE
jgi:hypothetical protein